MENNNADSGMQDNSGNNTPQPAETWLKKLLGNRIYLGIIAGIVLVAASVGGWQAYEYFDGQNIIKTETEPAAQLVRDDTVKPKKPKLFAKITNTTKSYSKNDEPYISSEIIISVDEGKCREYYGSDGVTQCRQNWHFLNPDAEGWDIEPALPGDWSFRQEGGRYYARHDFKQSEMKSDQKYGYKLPKNMGNDVELTNSNAAFSANPFNIKIESWSFSVDPQNPRKCVLSGKASSLYPIDFDSFKTKIKFSGMDKVKLGAPEFTYASNGTYVTFNVDVLELPKTSAPVRVEVPAGVKRRNNRDVTSKSDSSGVTVVGQDAFVSLSEASSFVVTDDEMISRQILNLEFTRPVKVSDVHMATRAIALPKYRTEEERKDRRTTRWTDYDVSAKALRDTVNEASGGNAVTLTPVPATDEYSTVVSFLYSNTGNGEYFYLSNDGGAASTTGYRLASFKKVMTEARIEPEVRIMQDGNILSLNASKTLAIFSRGMDSVRLSAWRVRPEYLNILVTKNDSGMSNTSLEGWNGVDFADISEEQSLYYTPARQSGSDPDYHALNLSGLLSADSKGILRVELCGRKTGTAHYSNCRSAFLLVTDLAMNVKLGQNGQRSVFVSSFAKGSPLRGVRVEVMGRNGLPVFSGITNAAGQINIPSLSGFNYEKRPVAIVAQQGTDFTYIPINDYSRNVSYSNFPQTHGQKVDVGGMSAFVFAERGIFRPGEELRFGALVKATDWNNGKLENLPVRVVLRNPRDTVVYDKKHRQDGTGLLSISIPVQETDPTGRYELSVSVDDRYLGSTQVQVEEFMPDNLKVTAGFNKVPPTGQKKGWTLPDDLKAIVGVENLYGTPAVGNNVDMTFSLTPVRLGFSQYGDYSFYDPGNHTRSYHSDPQRKETDEKGEVEFDLALGRYASGSYRLEFEAQAFETGGGRGVTALSSLLVSPHKVLVGWKSDAKLNFVAKDSTAEVEFIAIDNTLEKTSLKGLTLHISEVEYVASLIKDNSGRYRYDKVRRLQPVRKSSVDVSGSGYLLELPTDKTGQFELSLKDADGQERCNLGYVVAGGSQRRFGLERDATVRIHLDKYEYNGGDEMQIFISAPYAGSGLITVESDKVLAHKWFTATTSDSVQTIRVPREYEGRAFINVSMVRAIDSDAVHSTPFTYAVAPFIANIEKRNQKLQIDSPALVKPGDVLQMTVTADKPGKAVVFAVSEGILQLTSFKTPSPLTYFLRQNPLGVSTMQNWDMIMPEYYLMNQAAFGGDFAEQQDAPLGQLNPFRRKAEPSVVYWSGVVDAGPDGTTLEWEVPAYFNGTLRIMAVSAGASSIGEASRTTTVRGPLIITPDLPVAVAPGDEFEVTAAIANNVDDSGPGLRVGVKVELDEGLEFVRKPDAEITVDEGREGKATFRLRANDKLGESIVKISVNAKFDGETFDAKRPVSLSVRPSIPKISSFRAGVIKGNELVVPVGVEMYSEYAELEASVSGLPLPMMDALSAFLTRFPHGCTEQILSGAFPFAVMRSSQELMPVPRGMSPAQYKEHSEKAIQKGLVTLREREVQPGRFSLWPYSSGGYPFLTVYGLDYLLTAREAGFHVPNDLMENARRETQAILQSTPNNHESMRTMAYAAWVYTRSGERYTDLPRLVKNLDNNVKGWRSTSSAALIAGCYKMMQQDEEAEALIKGVKAIDPEDKKTSYYYSGWFYSRLWDNSMFLTALSRHFPERLSDNEGKKALVYVVNDTSSRYYTTSSAAQAVRAIAEYAAANIGQKGQLELQARDAQKNALPVESDGELVKRVSLGNEAHDFRFAGAKGLYWQISTNGFPSSPIAAQAKKIAVKVDYIPARGQKLEELAQGDEVYVLLTASATERIDNVAITSLIPGGFEMVISKGGQIVGGGANRSSGHNDGYYEDEEYYGEEDGYYEEEYSMDTPVSYPSDAHMRDVQNMLNEAGIRGSSMDLVHVERREDRMIAYTTLHQNERVFIFRIKAINKGKFTLPCTFAEALYDPDARANTAVGVIEIK